MYVKQHTTYTSSHKNAKSVKHDDYIDISQITSALKIEVKSLKLTPVTPCIEMVILK